MERLIAEVRTLAGEFPNRTAMAEYVSNDNPECIIGVALSRMGVSTGTLFDKRGKFVSEVCRDLGMDGTQDQESWLTAVQELQDADMPWGEAVSTADEEVEQ